MVNSSLKSLQTFLKAPIQVITNSSINRCPSMKCSSIVVRSKNSRMVLLSYQLVDIISSTSICSWWVEHSSLRTILVNSLSGSQ